MHDSERAAKYRRRALGLRADAETLADADGKRLVLEIADRYDELAQRIERTIAGSSSNPDTTQS
jgi:hypothetical protein